MIFNNALGEYLWRISELRSERAWFADLLTACETTKPTDESDAAVIDRTAQQARDAIDILDRIVENGRR